MRTRLFIPFVLAAGALATPVLGQVVIRRDPGANVRTMSFSADETPRAVIGVTTSTGDARDTLGLLVTDVTSNSPAGKAGIQEGDRIQSINGIDLKLERIDIGDSEMADAMARRLTRELGKVKPGDNVTLHVYHNGQSRVVTVKTVNSQDLYGDPMARITGDMENRAALGVSLGIAGSKRDTLGVLIMGVDDDSPAAAAGLEEGNRIAAINGVDLKVDRADAGDHYVSSARLQRLQKAMSKVKPGDDVALQVYADGRFKTVHVKAVKASTLGSASRTFMFRGDGEGPMNINVDGPQIRETIQRAMDQAQRSLERVRVEAPNMRWDMDESTPPMPPMPAAAPRAMVAPGVRVVPMPAAAPEPLRRIEARVMYAPRPPLRVIRF